RLVHPDAEITIRTRPTPLRGRREVAGYVDLMRDRVASIGVSSIENLGDDGVIVEGRKQYQTDDIALIDTPGVWVIRFRDRLVWRARSFPDRAQALLGAHN